MKYYIIAGEASGDLHASRLIRALRQKDPDAEIRAWGGDLMAAEGAHLVKHYRDLAFMGFVEVLLNLRTILGNLRWCKKDLLAFAPDALILVDYPGFNMRIAEFAKAQGLKVFYYIAPQVWAWKQKRVYQLRRDTDRVMVILPFEQAFFARFDMAVDFVGHPLLDALAERPQPDRSERRRALGLDPKAHLVALLPGSRKQEIQAMLPVMLAACAKKGLAAIVAGAPGQEPGFYAPLLAGHAARLISGQTYDLLEVADAALVTSGTATLETALFKVPQVVCYKANPLSYLIARQLIKVPFISLVNLVMEKEVVRELIQGECEPLRLARELDYCLSAEGQAYFAEAYQALQEKLGGPGASVQVAELITSDLR